MNYTVHINKDNGQSHNFLEGSYYNYSLAVSIGASLKVTVYN